VLPGFVSCSMCDEAATTDLVEFAGGGVEARDYCDECEADLRLTRIASDARAAVSALGAAYCAARVVRMAEYGAVLNRCEEIEAEAAAVRALIRPYYEAARDEGREPKAEQRAA
jgi:glycerol kinase